MTDPQQTRTSGTSAGLTIPDDVLQKFGPIIELIKGSESMNDEERQYWINILPIMTPEQLKNLEDILNNEKKQLQAIDEKYSKEVSSLGDGKSVGAMEAALKEKRQQREQLEKKAAMDEQNTEEDILKQIQSF